MVKYTITFVGRTKGAIGIDYRITDTREAESEQAAVLALYDKYDHVQLPHVVAEDGKVVTARRIER